MPGFLHGLSISTNSCVGAQVPSASTIGTNPNDYDWANHFGQFFFESHGLYAAIKSKQSHRILADVVRFLSLAS